LVFETIIPEKGLIFLKKYFSQEYAYFTFVEIELRVCLKFVFGKKK